MKTYNNIKGVIVRTGAALNITNPDGTPHLSNSIRIGEEENAIIVVLNKTSETVDIRYLGSIDEVDFVELSTASLTDGSVTPTFDITTIDDPWPFIKVEVMPTVSVTDLPQTTVSVKWASKRSRLNVV